MTTENVENPHNIAKSFNEGPITTTIPPDVSPIQNGQCKMPNGASSPAESENKSNVDPSTIRSKVKKERNGRRNERPVTENQAGPSKHDDQGCGPSRRIYYGIKSYLHHFYGPPDKEVLKSGEYVQGEDFRFLSEPQRKGCWVRVGLWIGINLIFLGGIAMLVGYLTAPRQAIVGQIEEYTVLDRWAVNFNYHLMLCQFVGLITFSFGAVIVVCSLLVANCQPPNPPPAYFVMGAYLPPPTPGKHIDPPTWGIHCIPLSGTVKSVQPQFLRAEY